MAVNIKQIKGSNELIQQSNFVKNNLNGKISFSDGVLNLSVPLKLSEQQSTTVDSTSYVTKQYVDTQIAAIDTGNHATAVSNFKSGTLIGTVTIDGNAVNFYVDLSDYAPLSSPNFSGTPTADTPDITTDSRRLATTGFVQRIKESLIDSAATNMNTISKIAAAVNNDPNYYSAVDTALNTKLNKSDITVTGSSGSGTVIGTITLQDTDYTFKVDLSAYAPLANPEFSGIPKAPTAEKGTSTQQLATTAFVTTAVSDIKGNPPTGLNTLEKISTALGNDSVFATSVNTALATKQPLSTPLTSISNLTTAANKVIYTTAKDVYAVTDLSSFMITNNILGSDSADAFRNKISALGLTDIATSAMTLENARAVDGVPFNGSSAISHYAVCNTAAGTTAKTVTIADITSFSLLTGARVTVRFSHGNTASNATLAVNGTAAKPIYYRGFAIPAGALQEMSTYDLVYNGLQWEIVGSVIWVDQPTVTAYTNPIYWYGYRISFDLSVVGYDNISVSTDNDQYLVSYNNGVVTIAYNDQLGPRLNTDPTSLEHYYVYSGNNLIYTGDLITLDSVNSGPDNVLTADPRKHYAIEMVESVIGIINISTKPNEREQYIVEYIQGGEALTFSILTMQDDDILASDIEEIVISPDLTNDDITEAFRDYYDVSYDEGEVNIVYEFLDSMEQWYIDYDIPDDRKGYITVYVKATDGSGFRILLQLVENE